MEQVQQTKEYNLFKILSGKRPIDNYHLKKLKNSIKKNNHLNLHPIIVNNNFEVIDGQHRLAAARLLGCEIFYIKSDQVNDEHLIECNVNDMFLKKRNRHLKGEEQPNSILTEKQVIEIRKLYKRWIYPIRKLSQEFGVSETCIKQVIRRNSWKHIP